MKKEIKKQSTSILLSEYDFSKGIRGKYVKKFTEGTNIVLLAPDVQKNFPDSKSVNETLRAVTKIVFRNRKGIAA